MPPAKDRPPTITTSVRLPTELYDQIDELAARMNISKQSLMLRIVRNGTDEIGGIVGKCENPIINLGMKIAVNLAANEEERQEILDQLNAIADARKERNQDHLPGLAT